MIDGIWRGSLFLVKGKCLFFLEYSDYESFVWFGKLTGLRKQTGSHIVDDIVILII
jgi:hypothetical protein